MADSRRPYNTSRETHTLPLTNIAHEARLITARGLVAPDVSDYTERRIPSASLPVPEAPIYGLQTSDNRLNSQLALERVLGVTPELGMGVEMVGAPAVPAEIALPYPPVPAVPALPYPPGPAGHYGSSGPAGPYGMPGRYGLPAPYSAPPPYGLHPEYAVFYMSPPGPPSHPGSRKTKGRKHKRKSLKSKKSYRKRKH